MENTNKYSYEIYKIGGKVIEKGSGGIHDLERPLPSELIAVINSYRLDHPFKLEIIGGNTVIKVWR